jgi:hypothetical protein
MIAEDCYSLIRLGGAAPSADALAGAFARYGAPFAVLDLPGEEPRAVYGCDLLLLRPDMHVVWRGNIMHPDCARLAALATGHV